MSGQGSQLQGEAGATEVLSFARFLEELRRVARFRRAPPIGDPLDAAVRRIENNPAFAQSRLLTRILSALAYQQGQFRRAEVAMLDAETLGMVIALMDVCAAGTTSREEWICAVDLANAAQAGAGG
jgi:hypothetical protein